MDYSFCQAGRSKLEYGSISLVVPICLAVLKSHLADAELGIRSLTETKKTYKNQKGPPTEGPN